MDAAQGVAHSWDGDMAVHAGMMGCGAMLSKLTGVLPGPCPKLAKVDWGGCNVYFFILGGRALWREVDKRP